MKNIKSDKVTSRPFSFKNIFSGITQRNSPQKCILIKTSLFYDFNVFHISKKRYWYTNAFGKNL